MLRFITPLFNLSRIRLFNSLNFQNVNRQKPNFSIFSRCTDMENHLMPIFDYEKLSASTLDKLASVFESIGETYNLGEQFDVQHGDDVLHIQFGPSVGTYVLNKQTPNRQIWLSSPISGPKRYDYDSSVKKWICKLDGISINDFLGNEISEVIGGKVSFDF